MRPSSRGARAKSQFLPMELDNPADTLTHGLTLKGAQYNWAILKGYKTVENRAYRIKPGWYALHTGVGKIEKKVTDEIQAALGDVRLPGEEEMPHGVIVGAVHISCGLPIERCRTDPWATGPVCNVLDAVYVLPNPVKARGQLATWKVDPGALEEVRRQLRGAPIHRNDVRSLCISVSGQNQL